MNTLLYVALVIGGYVASIFTWPWVRKTAFGVQAEAENLRAKARDLEATVKAKL